MAERTYSHAVDHVLAPLRLAISCVTPTIFTTPRLIPRSGALLDVLLGEGDPVRLRGPQCIHLRVRIWIRVSQAEPPRGLWEAQTTAYEYRLSDQDDREILAYHWHPEGQSHVRTPHLHLGPASEVVRPALLAAHLPTGQVGLHEVERLAIDSFGVAPIRPDWDRVLQA